MKIISFLMSASLTTFCILSSPIALADPASMMGSGNLNLGNSALEKAAKFNGLNQIGAKMIRVGIHPSQYWKKSNPQNPTPENLDEIVLSAYKSGIQPMVLFAHDGKKATIGTYDDWYRTGKVFAERFRPNSPWLLSQGIKDWGIEIFSAVNEPGGSGFPITGSESYYKLIEGLADGVHSAASNLRVIPGGFRSRGDGYDTYLKAIAPLLNQGKLDGIDLHVYRTWWHFTNRNASNFTAQGSFEEAKKVAGITRDINYYCTEFNAHADRMTPDESASLFLTMLWDQLGVVKKSGERATEVAMVWSLFNTTSDKRHGMIKSLDPWVQTPRADVMELVLKLSKNMKFIHTDPKNKGVYVLQKRRGGKITKMWVWQNLDKLYSRAGTQFRINYLPKDATKLKLYGWDGLRKTYDLPNTDSFTVKDLSPNEAYMFVAE